jgi:phenylpropionate dioxygenase-like ring-hydroxylating dioxygenase large terminal subunit
MTTAAENARVCLTGAAEPAGKLMRLYWQPVALAEELAGPRPVKALRIMGQDMVLFRDEAGRLGLLDRACPHRGADLAFARREQGGLRCPFHGWLFDVEGRCLEMPAEPAGSRYCERIRQGSYPVREINGLVFAYLGAGAPPALPDFDCFIAPASHSFAFKGFMDCNWLQALEVGIDPAHASFLHRFEEDESTDATAYGRQFRAASIDSNIPMTTLLREYPRPRIDVEPAEFGLRLLTRRELNARQTHLRVTNLLFPNAFVIPMSSEMTITQWHVPVADGSNYWFALFTSFAAPVDKEQMRRQRLELYELPDYTPRLNRANNWGYDPEEQRTKTYTGMGFDINVHDQWACESLGPIADRTREHLGTSDKAIIAYRRLLLRSIEQMERGETPVMVLDRAAASAMTGPASMDAIAPAEGWESYWREVDRRRRAAAPWSRTAA